MIKKLTFAFFALFAWPLVLTAQQITLANTGNPELDGTFTAVHSENGAMALKYIKTMQGKVYLISPLFDPTAKNTPGNTHVWLIHDSQGNEYFAVNTKQNALLAPPAEGWDVGRAGVSLNPNFLLAYSPAETATPKIAFTNPAKANTAVFPNPATSQLNIFAANQIKSITLTTLTGKIMLTGTTPNLDIATLPPGTYILIIEKGSESVRQKIIKQ